jgi:hypothetical protein
VSAAKITIIFKILKKFRIFELLKFAGFTPFLQDLAASVPLRTFVFWPASISTYLSANKPVPIVTSTSAQTVAAYPQ